ncbi:MAG: flagellar motor protein MotD [Chromatiales bacterium]|jgi:chemotaxis protein MotB|nr:flagellar motor protein MotD [Chromatiales bacterium]
MARKRKHVEHENHERWLISYADFITLLFAFFVVMYSISSINEGKYRVLSDSLTNAFRIPPKTLEPIQIGQPAKVAVPPNMNFVQRPNVLHTPEIALLPKDEGNHRGIDDETLMGRIADKLRSALADLMDRGLISVQSNPLWLEVEIKDSVLFPSGSAVLQPSALPVLRAVAEVLRSYPNSVRVEGFTDNKSIDTLLYPSNWELSATRASSVVRLMVSEGIASTRLSALGFADNRPIADNATEEGRARNRRVTLVVLSDDSLANMLDARRAETDPERMQASSVLQPVAGASSPAAQDATAVLSFPQSAVPLTGYWRETAGDAANTAVGAATDGRDSPPVASPDETAPVERPGFENGFPISPSTETAVELIKPIDIAPQPLIRGLITPPASTHSTPASDATPP